MSKSDPAKTPAVRIQSAQAGLWRCGVQHPAGPVDHAAGTFTADQLQRLIDEPLLVVTFPDGAAPAGGVASVDEIAARIAQLDDGSFQALAQTMIGMANWRGLSTGDGLGSGPLDLEETLEGTMNLLREAGAEKVREFIDAMNADPILRGMIENILHRRTRLLNAIAGLDREHQDHFTKSGKPEVRALEAATGLDDVTAAERDELWAQFSAT